MAGSQRFTLALNVKIFWKKVKINYTKVVEKDSVSKRESMRYCVQTWPMTRGKGRRIVPVHIYYCQMS